MTGMRMEHAHVTRQGFPSVSPGIFGTGIFPRLFVAVAVVVVLWTAMAWAVTAPAGTDAGRAAAPAAATRMLAASGA